MFVAAAGCAETAGPSTRPGSFSVHADFPGGSARVEALDAAKRFVAVSPARHPDRGWECWWYLRLDGLTPGETVTLEIRGNHVATAEHAVVSEDDRTWRPIGGAEKKAGVVRFLHRAAGPSAWFAWGPPYLLRHAQEAVRRAAARSPHALPFVLCRSRGGREVPAVRVSEPGEPGGRRAGIWIHARQHAWEAGSSWIADGFLDWLVSDAPEAVRLRRTAEIVVVPVTDIDSVEDGAGGKMQKPQDHSLDWAGEPHWPEVRAAQEQLGTMAAAGRLDLYVDLHNPGPQAKAIEFYVPPDDALTPAQRDGLRRLLDLAKAEMTGPVPFLGATVITGPGYVQDWNQMAKIWVTRKAPAAVATTMEVPWNTPHSLPEDYRRIGERFGCLVAGWVGGRK